MQAMDDGWRAFYAAFAAKNRERYTAPGAVYAAAMIAYRRRLLADAYFLFS